MSDDFVQLRVVRIVSETTDTKSYFLESVNGQAVSYKAGQFLTLILHRNGHEARRSYSLSSAPGESQLRLTIKRVQNGEISRYLHDRLRVGDILTSLHPTGRFTLDENQPGVDSPGRSAGAVDSPGDVVLLGAGSGITPLFALLKHILQISSIPRVTLLYSNPNERSIIFRDELDHLQRQFSGRFHLNLSAQQSN